MTLDKSYLQPIIRYEPGKTAFPTWQCPVCGFSNLRGVARCQNRRYADGPMVPTLKYGQSFDEWPDPKPVAEWCEYTRPCERCKERPGSLRATGFLCNNCCP